MNGGSLPVLKKISLSFLIYGGISGALLAETSVPPQKSVTAVEARKIAEEVVSKSIKNLQEAFQVAFLIATENAAKQSSQEAALRTHQDTLFKNKLHPFLGASQGSQVALMFADPYCGHCHENMDEFEKYMSQAPKAQLVIHNYPLFGKGSHDAVLALLAANAQGKYFEFYKAFRQTFEKKKKTLSKEELDQVAGTAGLDLKKFQADLKGPQIQDALKESVRLGKVFNIMGTPTFIVAPQGESDGLGKVMEGRVEPTKCFEPAKK
jgi:protein-disulfide isomerase